MSDDMRVEAGLRELELLGEQLRAEQRERTRNCPLCKGTGTVYRDGEDPMYGEFIPVRCKCRPPIPTGHLQQAPPK